MVDRQNQSILTRAEPPREGLKTSGHCQRAFLLPNFDPPRLCLTTFPLSPVWANSLHGWMSRWIGKDFSWFIGS